MKGLLEQNGLTVAADVAPLLAKAGLVTFDNFMNFSGGTLICRKRGRSVISFEIGDRTFYLKRNRFHRVEFWKTLSRFRLPPRSARQEWQSILAVRDAGIPTVPPVAMGEQLVCGVERASFTLTEALYDTEPLDQVIRREFSGELSSLLHRKKRAHIRRVAEIAHQLHSSGMYHQDLYLGHFLLGREDKLYLIDLQRVVCSKKVPRRYRVKDLGQLAYSAKDTGGLSRSDQMRFFLTYLECPHLGAKDKELLRCVLAKSRRIARHTVKLLKRRRRRGEIS